MNLFEFENDTKENFGNAPPFRFDWMVGYIHSQLEQMSPIGFSSIIRVFFLFIHYLLLKLTGKRDENIHKWINKKRFHLNLKWVCLCMSEMNI